MRAVIADVIARGDEALVDLSKKFDRVDLGALGIRVSDAEIEAVAASHLSHIKDEYQLRQMIRYGVIGRDGKVVYAYTDRNPDKHVENTLAVVKELKAKK